MTRFSNLLVRRHRRPRRARWSAPILIATDVIDVGETKTGRAPDADRAARVGRRLRRARRSPRSTARRAAAWCSSRRAGCRRSSSLFGLPQEQEGTATGSGFLVDDDGTIVTNAHVVEGSNDVTVSFEEDGDPIKAEVKGRDPSTDLAVLKVDPDKIKNARPVPLGRLERRREVGDPVVAIGNPFGFTRTVTTGIVSAVAREIKAPNGFSISNVIQTDASINPGQLAAAR